MDFGFGWLKPLQFLFDTFFQKRGENWILQSVMGEGAYLLAYVQNLTAISEAAMLDQGQVFPDIGPLTHYLLECSDMLFSFFLSEMKGYPVAFHSPCIELFSNHPHQPKWKFFYDETAAQIIDCTTQRHNKNKIKH